MPFQYVLANLLADNPDAEAVLFLDDAGETVDFACAEQSPYEMRLLGAYLGIYLRLIGELTAENRLGATRLFHIERSRHHLHLIALPEGYYLVLIQRRPARVGKARRSLRAAARQLELEIF
jgi:predicted regulator of Ras-like GTPase activity (Roadblock/LC7/MglB family)